MESNLDAVRREIELTRARMSKKIALLQQEVENTKRTTLNPAYHLRTRTWQTFGISVLAGWLLGRMAKPKKNRRSNHAVSDDRFPSNGVPENGRRSVVARAALAGMRATASSLLVKDLVKGLIGDYVKRRWSGGSVRRERRGSRD
jgi:hypothetical protein